MLIQEHVIFGKITMTYTFSGKFAFHFLTVGGVMEEEDGASDEWGISSKEPEK